MTKDKIREDVEVVVKKKLNISIDELNVVRSKFDKYKKLTIKTNNIFSNFDFNIVFGKNFSEMYNNIAYNSYDKSLKYLSEKCIYRGEYIKRYNILVEDNNKNLLESIKIANEIYNIFVNICPLELLYMMEFQSDDSVIFTIDQEKIFEFLKDIAIFYLNETDLTYEELKSYVKSKYQNTDSPKKIKSKYRVK